MMNTNFIPLSARVHSSYSYVLLPSNRQEQTKEEASVSSRSLTQFQRGRLSAQEVAFSYFSGKKPLKSQTLRELKGESVIPWLRVIDSRLVDMSSKAMRVALNRIMRALEWERIDQYLQECRQKLKANFQRFYLKVKEEREDLLQRQVKDQIQKFLPNSSEDLLT